jgi:hypothetical protein
MCDCEIRRHEANRIDYDEQRDKRRDEKFDRHMRALFCGGFGAWK